MRQPIQTKDGATIHVSGLVQGLVIGDHNTVNPVFQVTKHEPYIAREARALPAHWVERADLVAEGASALQPGSVVALVGMGGSGKSSLAARIAAQVAPRFAAGCFWIDLAAEDPDQALLRIALAFGHDISALTSAPARAQTVRSLLSGQPVLLVLDDAASTTALDPFLPLPASCAALLTTRNDAIAANAASHVLNVRELNAGDAVALLAAAAGGATAVGEPALPVLAELLGGLPLALELAGKLARQQARRPGFSWSTFAAAFADSTRRLSLGLAGNTVRAAFDATWNEALSGDARRAFALLGVFDPGEISTWEAAAAWAADDGQAVTWLNELIDLSLARPLDAVTLQLHPLLADHAHEKAAGLSAEERTQAHQRVADHLFDRAARPPRTIPEMALVLRSHRHAVAAFDHARAERVYPWLKSGTDQVSVPEFLRARGQYQTLVRHERLTLELARDNSAWFRAFATFRLGEALSTAGELEEAGHQLQEAITLIESPAADDDGRVLGLSKFLMSLGQVQAVRGQLAEAQASYQRAIDLDRKTEASGGVVGALSGALITMLQLGDLHANSDANDAVDQAERIFSSVFNEAAQVGDAQIAVMSLTRLARLFRQTDPPYALARVQQAREIATGYPEAIAGHQGARYARLLGETAADLALTGEPALDHALILYCLAISNAAATGAQLELGQALYQLGSLFEHYHILELDAPLGAAWACYALCEAYTREAEGGSPLNAQARIDSRIAPRVADAERAAVAAAVAADPWSLIDAALQPYVLKRPVDAVP